MTTFFVLCTNPKSFIGKLGSIFIRGFETEKYSHVAICGVTEGESWLWESVSPKSRKVTLDSFLKRSQVVKMYEILGNTENLDIFLDSLVGKPYAHEQLGIVVVASLTKVLNLLLRKTQINKEKRLICSELVYRALDYVFQFEKKENPDKIGIDGIDDVLNKLTKQNRLRGLSKDDITNFVLRHQGATARQNTP